MDSYLPPEARPRDYSCADLDAADARRCERAHEADVVLAKAVLAGIGCALLVTIGILLGIIL